MSNYIPLFYADVITYPYIASMMVWLISVNKKGL